MVCVVCYTLYMDSTTQRHTMTLREHMIDWLTEVYPEDLGWDPSLFVDCSDRELRATVSREYDGGWRCFVIDCESF